MGTASSFGCRDQTGRRCQLRRGENKGEELPRRLEVRSCLEVNGICAGYATKDSGTLECIIYGPGMAGACVALKTRISSRPTTARRWARAPTHRHVA